MESRRLYGLLPLWHDLGLGLIYSAAVGGWPFLLARWGPLWANTTVETANRIAAYVAVGSAIVLFGELVRLDRRRERP